MMFYISILIGATINLLLAWNEALAKPDYKFVIFARQNTIALFINLLIGFFLVYNREDITGIYHITNVSAAVLGSSGQYIWKKICNVFSSEVATKIGFE